MPFSIGGCSPAEVRHPHRHPDIASHRHAWTHGPAHCQLVCIFTLSLIFFVKPSLERR
jgi:hypothetical protein